MIINGPVAGLAALYCVYLHEPRLEQRVSRPALAYTQSGTSTRLEHRPGSAENFLFEDGAFGITSRTPLPRNHQSLQSMTELDVQTTVTSHPCDDTSTLECKGVSG